MARDRVTGYELTRPPTTPRQIEDEFAAAGRALGRRMVFAGVFEVSKTPQIELSVGTCWIESDPVAATHTLVIMVSQSPPLLWRSAAGQLVSL